MCVSHTDSPATGTTGAQRRWPTANRRDNSPRRAQPERSGDGQRQTAATITALTARVLLGIWFAYSGGVKILGTGLDRFTRDIANYQLVGPPLDAIAAYTVPWFEIVAGGCLLLGILRRGAILTIAGLVLVFCVCIGWAWIHQLDIACGCHGGDAPIQYWTKVAEFTGYFLLLAWLWRRERQDNRPTTLTAFK